MSVKVPTGAEPLSLTAFEERFTKILLLDMERHIAAKLGLARDEIHPLLEMATQPGDKQVVQFAVVNGDEPGVFTAPSARLSDQGREFADAVVSYFDSSGTYKASTGEMAPEAEAQLERMLDLRRKLLLDSRMGDTTPGQQLAICWLADRIQNEPSGVLARFNDWRETHPDADVGDFYNVIVPEDQRETIGAAYAEFRDLANTNFVEKRLAAQDAKGEEQVAQAERYATNFRAAANVQIAKSQNTAAALSAQGEAIEQSDLLVVEKATQLRDMRDGILDAQRTLQALQALAQAPKDVHTRVAQWLELRDVTTDQFFDAYAEVYRDFPDETPAQLTARLIDPVPGAEIPKLTEVSLNTWLTEEYPSALATLARECTASPRVIRETLERWVGAGVIRFTRLPRSGTEKRGRVAGVLPDGWPQFITRTERLMQKVFTQQFGVLGLQGTPWTAEQQAVLEALEPDIRERVLKIVNIPEAQGLSLDAFRALLLREKTRLEGESADLQSQADRYAADARARGLNVTKTANGYHVVSSEGSHAYMRAVEAQYGALADLTWATNKARAEGTTVIAGMSVRELFTDDIVALKRAETYCWFEEPILAVEAAAETLPDTVRLTRDLTEHWAAWWYFTLPQDIRTLPTGEAVQALLWGWEANQLRFSTYVRDEGKFDGSSGRSAMPSGLWPTAKFSWHEGETLAMALRRNREEHHERYTPEQRAEMGYLTPETDTMIAIERLLRFFIAGSLWVQQTILVRSRRQLHVMNKNKKARLEKQKGGPLGDVQIIHLRRKESVEDPGVRPADSKAIEWSCRWVVKGFWRNQYYPGRGVHEPKWIDPFVKGPADKPLKVHTHRVNVVNR